MALRAETISLRQEIQALRKENEALKDQLIPLIEQLQSFSKLIDWGELPEDIYHRLRSITKEGDFERVYAELPHRFTVDDLISACERSNVNVFAAYDHLKTLIKQGQLAEENSFFIKVQQPPSP